MRILPVFCATVCLSLIGTQIAEAQAPKTDVMIVGVSHLVARRDIHNSVYTDSPLSAKR